ncbi:hypothetical protein BC940DRAFT_317914 [Gongronella butleri]|nr:hypothetical protein BC940DRAFT_317914 [Gongronella butleri]
MLVNKKRGVGPCSSCSQTGHKTKANDVPLDALKQRLGTGVDNLREKSAFDKRRSTQTKIGPGAAQCVPQSDETTRKRTATTPIKLAKGFHADFVSIKAKPFVTNLDAAFSYESPIGESSRDVCCIAIASVHPGNVHHGAGFPLTMRFLLLF